MATVKDDEIIHKKGLKTYHEIKSIGCYFYNFNLQLTTYCLAFSSF